MKKIVLLLLLLIALCGCSNRANLKYEDAIQYLENRDYDQAITLFEELAGFGDSEKMLKEAKYRKAEQLCLTGQFTEAIDLYNELGPYKESPKHKRDAMYGNAELLYDSGQYQEARDIFSTLLGYEKCEEYIVNSYIAEIKKADIGDHVFFGEYEQDGIDGNGPEEIEWVVLDRQDNRVLLLSSYILERIPFNNEYARTTWESSTIREWLNNDFYYIAFNEEAQKYISLTLVEPELSTWTSPSNQESAGNVTKDHVFLLSISETETIGSRVILRVARTTVHAGIFDEPAWWLRNTLTYKNNSGETVFEAHYMQYNGNTEYRGKVSGEFHNSDFIVGARPAIWIEINS